MTEIIFKWTSSLGWLLQYIAEAAPARCYAIAAQLAAALDADTIQDMFSYEMERDGYFEPVDTDE